MGVDAVRRLSIAAALLTVFLAGPVFAQQKPYSIMTDEEKAQQKVVDSVDRQYRATLNNTRKEGTVDVQVDPWSNMRGDDSSKKKR